MGNCFHKNDFYCITEYMEQKSLKNVLDNKKIELKHIDRLQMSLDITLAIYYMHSRNPRVVHRDLKSSNCLVDKFLRIKLCDFGISKIYEKMTQVRTNSSSTCFWMAPEFIMDGIFTEKSDIYSLGILLWEIFTRDTIPYKNMNEANFLIGNTEILKKRPLMPQDMDPGIKQLIENCWAMDPQKRPEISEVITSLEDLISKVSD